MQENYSPVPVDERPDVMLVEPQDENRGKNGGSNTGRNIAIVAGVLVVVALIILALYGMATNPGLTEVIRDISIIVFALVSIVIGILLAILTWQVWRLTVMVQQEIKPILESTQRTIGTVRGTTAFMSDKIAKPAIEAASMAAGIGAGMRQAANLFRRNGRRGR